MAARCLAPSESPAGSRSLRGHRAASALPQRVYPVADNETRLEGDRGGERKGKIWHVNPRADGKNALEYEV